MLNVISQILNTYIGTTLPNKEVACGKSATDFTATKNVETPCTVKNDAKHMTDVFPVVFHDAI